MSKSHSHDGYRIRDGDVAIFVDIGIHMIIEVGLCAVVAQDDADDSYRISNADDAVFVHVAKERAEVLQLEIVEECPVGSDGFIFPDADAEDVVINRHS